LKAVKQGRSLTLTYRNKPLARIVPLKDEQLLSEDDPIYRMYELAEPIGVPLTNEEMDKLIYGRWRYFIAPAGFMLNGIETIPPTSESGYPHSA
jgi:hypothetical protein